MMQMYLKITQTRLFLAIFLRIPGPDRPCPSGECQGPAC